MIAQMTAIGLIRKNRNQPSPSVTSPKMKMKIASRIIGTENDDEVDQELHHAPRQHALEQVRRLAGS